MSPSFSSTAKAVEEARKKAEALAKPAKPGKKSKLDKKKTNLEIFKEELKAIQQERDKRAGLKPGGPTMAPGGNSMLSLENIPGSGFSDMLADVGGDPTTTNLYLGNLSPRLTEPVLTEMFGKFGPLASVKIMYPRTEDEKLRGKHCGFVAYMARIDGERALAALGGKQIEGFEMRMGWGKPVPIPLHPVYVPPALLKYTMPPTPSGLPFNCQPDNKDRTRWGLGATGGSNSRPTEVPTDTKQKKQFDRMLSRSTVKVVIPTDRTQLCLINRMVEFVIREGPIFEATIMNRELNNPQFKFLFENQSPEHIYYRWRLYSVLQGETKEKWSTAQFKMFRGGSFWRPPLPNIYTSGMPVELLDSEGASMDPKEDSEIVNRTPQEAAKSSGPPPPGKRALTDSQRDTLEETLRSLLPDRNAVAEAMVWCIEHADSGEEIVECLAESLSILETPTVKKIARLFLISDILHNCTVKGVPNVSFYRTGFQVKLCEIFTDLNLTYKKIPGRMKAESFKQRVMACFRAWEDWALYPMDFLIKLQNIFLGLVSSGSPEIERRPSVDEKSGEGENGDETDEDVDGVPLDGAALLKVGGSLSAPRPDSRSDDSLDGAPIDKAGDKSKTTPARPAGFVASKWETVDPEDVKAGAITTSKWEAEETDQLVKARKALMGSVASKWDEKEDLDGEPLEDDSDSGELPDLDTRVTEERRALLRDIEVKVMQYQDELECGKKGIKSGWTISEQVEHYRKKMVRRANERLESPKRERSLGEASDSPERSSRGEREKDRGSRKKRRKRSRSDSVSRSKSRERNRSRDRKGKRRRSRSESSSSDRGVRSRKDRSRSKGRMDRSRSRSRSSRRQKRSRSRSRSPRKHKKKHR